MNLLHGCLKNNVKTIKRIVIPVFILVSSSCFGQEYSKSWKDINYAGDEMNYHNLDIYLPAVERPSCPVVIVIYGSAWFSNNLKGSDLKTLGKALPDGGFAVVMPNHRSSADAKFPAQINDIKAVIRFIRAEMDLYYYP
jgi:acetyl esterase/lipase